MPTSRNSKKTCKRASKTSSTASNGQTNIPANPVSGILKDPNSEAWQSIGAPVDKFGRTPDVWSAVMQLRVTLTALDTVNRDCIARCDDLEKKSEIDAFRINVLEELVAFLALKMNAHLEIINHLRVLGHRPKVTAEDLYRAGLWQYNLSSGCGEEQPSPTDLSNIRTDQEPSLSFRTSHPERDYILGSITKRSDEPTALANTDPAAKIPVASLPNDDPPSRYQRPSQPSQERDKERVQIETPTALPSQPSEERDAEKVQIETPTTLPNDDALNRNQRSSKPSQERDAERAQIETPTTLPNDDPLNRNQRSCQPSQERDAERVQIETPTALPNDDPPSRYQRSSQPSQERDAEKVQTEIPSAENHNNLFAEIEKLKQQLCDLRLKVANCDDISGQLTGELTDRSGSIATIERRVGLMYLVSRLHGGDQKAPYNIRDAFIGSKISNAGQGPGANAFIDSVFLDTTNLASGNDNRITSLDNFKHSTLDGKLTREGSSISGQQEGLSTELVKDISTTTLDISQELRLDEEGRTETLNMSQDQHLVEVEGKNSRRSPKHLSEETADARRDKSFHKVIEGQRLQKAEYSQMPKSQQDEIDEIARLHDEILLLQNFVGEAFENGSNGSSAFSHNLANSLTEQDKANGSELDELVKENAYLTEKLKILASVDLVIEDSRIKTGALQDAVGSQPHQSRSAASGTSAPNLADMPSGLLATKDAALILASLKIPRQNQPRQPVSVDSIKLTNDDVHDKSTSQDLSTSQRTWRLSQSEKPNSDSGLHGEISKTKPQVEFKLAAMEDSHDDIFLSQSKDRPQPVVDDVAESEGQVNNDRERKHDGQPRKADFSTQIGAYTTTEMPLRLNDSTKNTELTTNEESANSPQEKTSYPQSSSTAERAREASNEVHEAHSEWKTKVGGKTAPLYVPQQAEYVYHGCDHPFL